MEIKQINISAKKSEADWIKTLDNFYNKLAPLWFEILNWVIIIGIFHYLADITKNVVLIIITAISYFAFWKYCESHLLNIYWEGIPFTKNIRSKRKIWGISIIIGGATSLGIFFLLQFIIKEISGKL